MNAFFFALLSYFTWGSGDLFGTIASRRIGGAATTFLAILGFFVFKDPITKQQGIGIAIALGGIIILGCMG